MGIRSTTAGASAEHLEDETKLAALIARQSSPPPDLMLALANSQARA